MLSNYLCWVANRDLIFNLVRWAPLPSVVLGLLLDGMVCFNYEEPLLRGKTHPCHEQRTPYAFGYIHCFLVHCCRKLELMLPASCVYLYFHKLLSSQLLFDCLLGVMNKASSRRKEQFRSTNPWDGTSYCNEKRTMVCAIVTFWASFDSQASTKKVCRLTGSFAEMRIKYLLQIFYDLLWVVHSFLRRCPSFAGE